MERFYRWFGTVKMSDRRVLLPVCFMTVSLTLYIAFINTQAPETAQTTTIIMQQERMASGSGSRLTNDSRSITLRQGTVQKSEEETFSLDKCKTPKKDLCYEWGAFDRLSSDVKNERSYKEFMDCTFTQLYKVKGAYRKLHENPEGSVFDFLPNYRSACWIEDLPGDQTQVYSPSKWSTTWRNSGQKSCVHRRETEMVKLHRTRQKSGDNTRIRCLPNILLLGMFKAGTVDFFKSLNTHQDVEKACVKEPHFFVNLQPNLEQYLNIYDAMAENIRSHVDQSGYHARVTIDATTGTFKGYSSRVFTTSEWHKEKSPPCITLPQHIKHVFPQTKAVLLLRNPTDWMESCFNHFSTKLPKNQQTPEVLHKHVQDGIVTFDTCMTSSGGHDLWACYNMLSASESKWPCRVENMIYYIFVRHWGEILGGENFLVINSNAYYSNRLPTLAKTLKYLGLKPYSESEKRKVLHAPVANKAKNGKKVAMLEKTRKQITEFVRPYNKLLSEYLKDNTYLWE